MNATVALFALAGLGAYVAIRWLLRREGAARIAGVLASLLVVASFGYIWVNGRDAAQWADPDNQWIDQPTRTALAAARAVVENEPGDSPGRLPRELRRYVPVLRMVEDLHERLAHRPARRRREALDDVLRHRGRLPRRRADGADRRHLQQDVARVPPRAHRAPRGVHGRPRSCSSSASSTPARSTRSCWIGAADDSSLARRRHRGRHGRRGSPRRSDGRSTPPGPPRPRSRPSTPTTLGSSGTSGTRCG